MDYGEMWGALWKTVFQVTSTYTNVYAVPGVTEQRGSETKLSPSSLHQRKAYRGSKEKYWGVHHRSCGGVQVAQRDLNLNRGHAMSIRLSLYDISLPCGCCHGKEQSRPLSQGVQQMGGARSQHTRALSKRHRASPSGQSL